MDFDIGNILYIIITLVALSLGLFGKKKKRPAGENPDSSGNASEPGFLENLEKALSGLGREETEVVTMEEDEPDMEVEEADYEPFKEYLATKEKEANARSASYEDLTHQEPELTRAMDPEQEDSDGEPLNVVQLDPEVGVDYFDVVRDFDLGTAVVYSAIINRLDY